MMKKNVAILIFDDAEVLDFSGPFEVFSVTSQINEDLFYNVFTISEKTDLIKAVNGLKVQPDFSTENHPHIDILILSGGQGTKTIMNNERLLNWIYSVYNRGSLIVSICSGSRLIGKLGLLNEKKYCTHHQVYDSMEQIVINGFPQKHKRFVQSDERIYTSGGISAGIDLSFHIIQKELGENIAQKTADYMEYRVQYL
ncbi:DJ-1/PfpI family protein [Chryseobacterium aureum]|uniref:DJ-1/PfpI family protein n=1 Tax=Chryseobacterium aureum TaxID=2497456 RepID=UPI001E354FB9|nr:DJ-1/PfpI family protein [Chryseobacterium aureum]